MQPRDLTIVPTGTPRSSYSSLSPLSSLSSFSVSSGCASVLERRVRWNNDRLFSRARVPLFLSLLPVFPRLSAHTYVTHVAARACTGNISIETRRFSILQVCNRLCGTMEPAVEQFLHCARPDEREEKDRDWGESPSRGKNLPGGGKREHHHTDFPTRAETAEKNRKRKTSS